jgi:hypothetical protein
MGPLVVPLAMAAVSVIGGIMGQRAQAKSDAEKKKLLEQAKAEYDNIQDPEAKAVAYEELKSAGMMVPELEKEIQIPDTAMIGIQSDPLLKQAQMDALSQLQNLGKSGGLDEADKANLERARQNFASESASQQAGVAESMARRGMSSGGLELAQRQMAAQNAANQMGNTEAQIQGEARRRALDAIMQGGQLGGQMRNQEMGEKERQAAAIDRINEFRATNAIGAEQRRVSAANAAQAANLANAQRIADANVGFKNTSIAAANAAPQQSFQNKMAIAGGKAGTLGSQAVNVGQQGQQQANMFGGLVTGINQLGAGYSQSQQADSSLNAKLAAMTPEQRDEYNRLQGG